jgi:hypothetical protein
MGKFMIQYKQLIENHHLFLKAETRAINYEDYLSCKDWKYWFNPNIPLYEIKTLFKFVKSWDRFFRCDVELFQKKYPKILLILKKLKDELIEETKFSQEIKENVRDVFDLVASCGLYNLYESTGASIILHLILPHFFVPWDKKIKAKMFGGGGLGAVYAFRFLPKMQLELNKAIKTCMEDKWMKRKDAIRYIRKQTNDASLPRLIDEYNYMKFSIEHQSLTDSAI